MTEAYTVYVKTIDEQIKIYQRLKERYQHGFKWCIINVYTKKSRGYYKTKEIANNFLSLNKGEAKQLIIVQTNKIFARINNNVV